MVTHKWNIFRNNKSGNKFLKLGKLVFQEQKSIVHPIEHHGPVGTQSTWSYTSPASCQIVVPLNKKWSILMWFNLHNTFAPFSSLNIRDKVLISATEGQFNLFLSKIDEAKASRANSAC